MHRGDWGPMSRFSHFWLPKAGNLSKKLQTLHVFQDTYYLQIDYENGLLL